LIDSRHEIVGWAKRSVPTITSKVQMGARRHSAAFAHPTSYSAAAARGFTRYRLAGCVIRQSRRPPAPNNFARNVPSAYALLYRPRRVNSGTSMSAISSKSPGEIANATLRPSDVGLFEPQASISSGPPSPACRPRPGRCLRCRHARQPRRTVQTRSGSAAVGVCFGSSQSACRRRSGRGRTC